MRFKFNLSFIISILFQYPVEAMLKVLQHYQGLHRSPSSAFSPLSSAPLVISNEETQSSSAFNKVRITVRIMANILKSN